MKCPICGTDTELEKCPDCGYPLYESSNEIDKEALLQYDTFEIPIAETVAAKSDVTPPNISGSSERFSLIFKRLLLNIYDIPGILGQIAAVVFFIWQHYPFHFNFSSIAFNTFLLIVFSWVCIAIFKYLFKPGKYSISQCDGMDGHKFEYFCADILRSNGFSNVIVTQGSGDFGIDVLAERAGMSYAIQCKCYSQPVGNHAVQEAYSGAAYYKKQIAVVMTNQTYTPAAIKTANQIGVELWDRNQIQKMIAKYNGQPGIVIFLKRIFKILFGNPAAAIATILTSIGLCGYFDTTAVAEPPFTFLSTAIAFWLITYGIAQWVRKKSSGHK